MTILDNQTARLELDSHQVGQAIELLPEQLFQVITDFKNKASHKLLKPINKIVLNGMGGSNLGARLIASALADKLPAPLIIEPGYTVPNYIDEQTLYIVSSYSGTTEEPLSTVAEAMRRGAQLAAITADTAGNPLAKLARDNNWPAYIFTTENNPSGQPRLGLGYAIFGLLGLLGTLDIMPFDLSAAETIVKQLKETGRHWLPEVPTEENDAKQLALQLQNRQIWLIGPDKITGNLHILRNQINETSKNLANYLVIPELNHYAMEGLSYPTSVKETVAALSFKITGLNDRMAKRLELTDEVLEENGLPVFNYHTESTDSLGQALEILAFGGWLSYYLGLLNGVDPVKIPWVDLFKKKLA
ncbi:MAG TPA: SIS domain-containing protein [bacterium]|nr:SIS domain-containing protein [bacterium]